MAMRVLQGWTSALALLALAGCERGGVTLGGEAAIDPAACGAPAVLISSIQGAALKSPLQGQLTTSEAVVIADAIDGLGGVFLQEEQADRDGDPMTSEGLFVQIDGARPKVERGDVVRVQGRVAEIGEGEATLTALVELSSFQFCGRLDELPQAALVEEAPLVAEDWEALESMGLRIEPIATLLSNHALLARGEMLVGLDGRQWSPTERHPPGAEARALAADNDRRRLLLDDGSITRAPPERVHWLPATPSIDAPYRIGSSLRGIAGVLDQRQGSYRLHVQERVEVVQAQRPESAPEVAGTLRVASMNVLNYFNGDGRGGGFPTARGASDAEELTRQRAKILSALKAMDADLYVLVEIENDGYERGSAIAELTQRLNQARGRPREYDYVRAPGERLGGDLISVGMLYRPRKLAPVGPAASLQQAPFDHGSRAPLAQTFELAKTRARLTVVANHWKSKGGCEGADAADQDRGDGQGCWNGARVAAARLLKDWLASDPTASGDPDLLIVGDLNAYSQEDPMRLLHEAGYVPLGQRDADHYSYHYDGASGSLDHALASASLAPQARGAAVWHINADEMPDFDYNREQRPRAVDARMFRSDPFRSSDHDPLLVGFDLEPPAQEPESETESDEAAVAADPR